MTAADLDQPDVTLHMNLQGVIQNVTVAPGIEEDVDDAWCGKPWSATVEPSGVESVERLIDLARRNGIGGHRQIHQQFPSGAALPIHYTTVRLDGSDRIVATGNSMALVADLQARLAAAQEAVEQSYWKLRAAESRYRLLFDASNDPVLLLRANDLVVVDSNPAAFRSLGIAFDGRPLLPELMESEREPFQEMLQRVRERGDDPGMLLHLAGGRQPWVVTAAMMATSHGPLFLLQFVAREQGPRARTEGNSPFIVSDLVERLPDGFVVLDLDGAIQDANGAFLQQVQVGARQAVLGQDIERWLNLPGADGHALVSSVRRFGSLRSFETTLRGELGSEIAVDISAILDADAEARFICLLVRDITLKQGQAGPSSRLGSVLGSLTERIGQKSLRALVKDTVRVVERHYIESALNLTSGNRTAAAEILGLSRQSLYVKLNRYGTERSNEPDPDSMP